MCDKYYKETTTYTDDDGNTVEVNDVLYERTDGLGIDYVQQTKVNGVEVGHHTEHPDGTVHDYGIYAENDDEDDYDDDEEDDNNSNNKSSYDNDDSDEDADW